MSQSSLSGRAWSISTWLSVVSLAFGISAASVAAPPLGALIGEAFG